MIVIRYPNIDAERSRAGLSLDAILNEFLHNISDDAIDYDNVSELTLTFLRYQYIEKQMSVAQLSDLMYKIALLSGRYADSEPWYTMYLMGDFYSEANNGFLKMDDFLKKFDLFSCDGICFDIYRVQKPKQHWSIRECLLGIFRRCQSY